jgi:4-hydroxybenzoyl-CoA thioesterase/acyl-CoA thioester hydrolase
MSDNARPPNYFSAPVRVYIEDTDAGGIVYYVNYLKYMERGRTEFMRSLGFDKSSVITSDKLMVVHSANTQYHSPAYLDDSLMINTNLRKVARSYVIFFQQVFRDGELLCSAEIKVACVVRGLMKPVAIPSDLRASLMSYLEPDK